MPKILRGCKCTSNGGAVVISTMFNDKKSRHQEGLVKVEIILI